MNAPIKTVAVPLATLANLFAAGNRGGITRLRAADMASNVIEHTAFELQLIAEAINNPDDRAFGEHELYLRCYALSNQLEAALEIVGALDAAESETGSEAAQ